MCMKDCISTSYILDVKKVTVTIEDPGMESVQVYISYRTLTEVQETLTGKVLY